MPNYEAHLTAGAIVGTFAGVYVYSIFEPFIPHDYAVFVGMLAWEAVLVGSVLPDIDLHNSKPRALLNAGLVIATGGAAYLWAVYSTAGGLAAPDPIKALAGVIALAVMVIAARIVPDIVQLVMPKHRGVLHNPAPWLVVFGMPAMLLWRQAYTIPNIDPAYEIVFIAPVLGGVFAGTLVHLGLDYSNLFVEELSRRRRYNQF